MGNVEKRIVEKLGKVVGMESSKEIVDEYRRLNDRIRKEKKSKVMYYQRRVGMRMVLGRLGVSEGDLRELYVEWYGERGEKK